MEKEIYSSKEVQDFLERVRCTYETGGIWVARRFGRRWSFLCGIEPTGPSMPARFKIDDDYMLFCENPEKISKKIVQITNKLRELLVGK
ncbi:MAG TPA: hypothetical protein PKU94_05930 [Candidatus Hydrothermia bacterium]|nr:hypothetical protein [Candidatus Hydrothermae bacterium]MDD3648566.1 hypothetical protein [Candidatus Hydrothermia bacterium]MDD5572692.1 hypothetical protein [Candidatus Hydrothermia bacterium]HOK22574.1 hypothetical protein [Candidatus Hydrothermia bacterium]HOL23281.1 hypothetical protein [Candidatus Hydrothermia bacterium]